MDNADMAHRFDAMPQPTVAQLLAVDALYRELAGESAPAERARRRVDAERSARPPVLHKELEGRRFSASFSHTAPAHALGPASDEVVITYEDARGPCQCTVVTARRGVLSGLRVVQGREADSRRFHARSFARARRQLRDEPQHVTR